MRTTPPEATTSIRIAEEDTERLRSLAGQNDAHRIAVALDALDERYAAELGEVDGYDHIPLNDNEKSKLEEFPGDTWAERFHSFIYTIEQTQDVDLKRTGNVVVR